MAISTGAYLSRYSEVLKTFYLPAIQDTMNNDNILAAMIDVNEEDIDGKDAKIEMHYGRNTGTGSRADGAALPDAGYQKYIQATVPMKYHYGQVRITGPTIAATRSDKGAYARVIDNEITGVVRDVKKEINRQLWGAGWGMLGHSIAADSTAIELAKQYRGNVWGDGFGCGFGAKYFKENSSGNVMIAGGLSSPSTADFTIDTTDIAVTGITTYGTISDTMANTTPGQNTAEGDFLVRPGSSATFAGAADPGGARIEMMGIRGIATDENIDHINTYDATTGHVNLATSDDLQDIDATSSSYTWWRAIVNTATGTRYAAQRALTFRLMQTVFDQVEENAGRNYGPDLILTTRAIRREYLELCRADRRAVNTMSLDGGWEALDYNGVPLMVDNDAIDGEMYFLTTKDLQIYRMSDYDWMEKDGSVLHRVTGYDAYDATLFRYAELGCKRRNSQGVLVDLNYTLA